MKPQKEKKRDPFSNNNYAQVGLSFQRKNNNAKANPRIFNGQRQQRESFDVRMLVKIRGKRKSSETFFSGWGRIKILLRQRTCSAFNGGKGTAVYQPWEETAKRISLR